MPEGTYVLPFDTFATVTLQYAVISPFLQVIVAVPTPLPVTRPLLSTEATPLLLLLQLTLLFDALLGCTEAVSCAEFPTPNVTFVLLSVMPVTPCFTTTVHDADFLRDLRAYADAREALLVFDEIATGLNFGAQAYRDQETQAAQSVRSAQ